MAGKNISMNLSLQDKGNTIKARTKDAKALNAELARSQKLATGTRTGAVAMSDAGYGQARGSAGATGAAGRDFANQAQGLGGLVRLYATYAANVFAVSAAFRALSEAMNTSNMIRGLDQLGARSGVAMGSLAKQFTEAAGGAISLRESVEATAKAVSSGLSAEQFLRLGKVAKTASQALGISMGDAVSRLTRGITKLEPELLDELGIFTKVGKAAEDYAKSVGKTVGSLTDLERRQAFANAALGEGESKFGDISLATNSYDQLLAKLKDTAFDILNIVNKVIAPIAQLLADNSELISIGIAAAAYKITKSAVPALGQWREGLKQAAQEAKEYRTSIVGAFGESVGVREREASGVDSMIAAKATRTAALSKVLGDYKNSAIIRGAGTASSLNINEKTGLLTAKSMLAVKRDIRNLEILNTEESRRQAEILKTIRRENAAIYTQKRQVLAIEDKLEASANKPQSYFSEEAQRDRIRRAAARNDAKLALLSGVGDRVQKGGIGALGGFYKDVDASKDLTKLDKLSTKIRGTFSAGSTAVSIFMRSLSGALGYLGLAVTAFTLLDTILSTNTQSLGELNSAIDNNEKVLTGAAKTAEVYSNVAFNTEKVIAYNTSLQSINTSLTDIANKYADTIANSSMWDKAIDHLKGLVGFGFAESTAESIVKSTNAALEKMTSGAARDEVNRKLKAVFGTDAEGLGLLDPKVLANGATAIAKIVSASAQLNDKLTKPLQESKTSIEAIDEAYKNYSASLAKSSPLNTLLQAQFKALKDISDVLKQGGINALALANNLSKLETPGVYGLSDKTIQAATDIALARENLADAEQKIDQLKQKITDLQAEEDKSGPTPWRTSAMASASAQLANESTRVGLFVDALKDAEKTLAEEVAKATRSVIADITRQTALVQQQGAVNLQKIMLGAFAKTPESIQKMADLEVQSIDIRKQEINALYSLAERLKTSELSNRITAAITARDKIPQGTENPEQIKEASRLTTELTQAQNFLDLITGKKSQEDLVGSMTTEMIDWINKNQTRLSQLAGLSNQQAGIRAQAGIDAQNAAIGLRQDSMRRQLTINDLIQQRRELSPGYNNRSFDAISLENQSRATQKIDYEAQIKILDLKDKIKRTTGDTKLLYESLLKFTQDEANLQKNIVEDKAANARIAERERVANQNAVRTITTETQLSELKSQSIQDMQEYEKQILDIQLNRGQITQDQYNVQARSLELKSIEVARTAKLLQLENARKAAMQGFNAIINSQDPSVTQAQRDTAQQDKLAYDQVYQAQVAAANQTATMQTNITSMVPVVSEAMETIGESIKGAFSTAGDAIANFVETGKWNFKSLMASILADMARAQLSKQFSNLGNLAMQAFTGYITNASTAATYGTTPGSQQTNMLAAQDAFFSAKGNAFATGIEKFAKGGAFTNSVVNSPTMFKFAKGVGLMGEAGPEAIMPLKRDSSGNLGVRADNNTQKTEVVINNYGNQQATASETMDSRGNRRIEVTVGEMTAGNISSSNSSTQRSMATTFGLRPQLIRR